MTETPSFTLPAIISDKKNPQTRLRGNPIHDELEETGEILPPGTETE
jgi:hypothetical protein